MSNSSLTEGMPDFAVNAAEGLIRQILLGNAIVYVGAGVSQSAGLPSWEELLGKIQEAAEGRIRNQDETAKAYFDELKKRSRSLEVGEWLLRLLGPEFQQVVSKALSVGDELCQIEPSMIHWNLLRIPFSMAVTTNFDQLLEMAYDRSYRACPQKLPPLTWKHTEEILRNRNPKEFRIVHSHGTVGDSNSIVLSASQYNTLAYARPRFLDVMKDLFKTKTFLFTGAGLEDPDLIFTLQEAIAENSGAVGPHYALLPYHQAPQIRRDILRDMLHIEVIPVGYHGIKAPTQGHWLTKATSDILQGLAGRVALKRLEKGFPGTLTSDDPTFCLKTALRNLLRHSIEYTGSWRGDICLSPDGVDSHLSGELLYSMSEGPTGGDVADKPVPADSVCGIAYFQSPSEQGVYVGDVHAINLAREIQKHGPLGHYGTIKYVQGDNNVHSELALPIEADGVRVGVLNLESNLKDAYGSEMRGNTSSELPDYIKVARKFAEKAGRLYAIAHERNRRGNRLAPERVERLYDELRKIFQDLWCIARNLDPALDENRPDLAYLIYKANFRSGRLESQSAQKTLLKNRFLPVGVTSVGQVSFPFDTDKKKNEYLSTRVFLNGRPYFYPDVYQAIQRKFINNSNSLALGLSKYVNEFGQPLERPSNSKKEPIIGFPIHIHGHVGGVLAAWIYRTSIVADNADGAEKIEPQDSLNGVDIELSRRAAHLLANHYDWDRGDRGLNGDPLKFELAPLERVRGVLDSVMETSLKKKLDEEEALDESGVGKFFKDSIGAAVGRFLCHLAEQEYHFRLKMGSRGQQPPSDWVSPRRCRCWVRAKVERESNSRAGTSDNLTFILAFQVEVKAGEVGRNGIDEKFEIISGSWKNQYLDASDVEGTGEKQEAMGLGMQPSQPSPEINQNEAHKRKGDRVSRPKSGVVASVNTSKGPRALRVRIIPDNPHLGFLLSRIRIYPFSFQQRPRIVGEDVMSRVLEKDKNLPWFVAPVILARRDQWIDMAQNPQVEQPHTFSTPATEVARDPDKVDVQRQLVGYFTFDRKKSESEGTSQEEPNSAERDDTRKGFVGSDEWGRFQNDLLHQMALFGACIAHRECWNATAQGIGYS